MLAVLGFTVTGVLFAIFASTFQTSSSQKLERNLRNFQYSYFLLSASFLGYGIASAIGTPAALSISIIVGNLLLLAATILQLSILLEKNKYRTYYLYGLSLIGAIMILIRTFYFYPKPYLESGMLFFNSQRFVSFILSAAFLIIWLPVNLGISRALTRRVAIDNIASLYALMYTSATFSAVMFMLAKKPSTLVLSFVALSTAFLMLIASNLFVKSIGRSMHGKQRAK